MRFALTLRQVFVFATMGLALLLGGLFYVFTEGTRNAILQSSEKVRDVASLRIESAVTSYLREAASAVRNFENELKYGPLSLHLRDNGWVPSAHELDEIEAFFFAELMQRPNLSEMTWTWTGASGRKKDGSLRLVGPHGELSVYRMRDGAKGQERLWTRRLQQDAGHFRLWVRRRQAGEGVLDRPLVPLQDKIEDPTSNATFLTPTDEDFYGKPLWSDLHRSTLRKGDIVVTVQKAMEDARNRFAGVLRVGLSTDRLDRVALKVHGDDPNDAHIVFLCDNKGRLVTRLPFGRFRTVETEDDLKWASLDAPPAVTQALLAVQSLNITAGTKRHLRVVQPGAHWWDDEAWLMTFRGLEGTQDWVVGIVVPESYYLGDVIASRNHVLLVCLVIIAVIMLCGALTLRQVRDSLGLIVSQAARMARFDFSKGGERTRLRDVQSVLESLEGAKTALRAMGKYVPVDLVAQLYRRSQEPVLGGEMMDVTLLFTDLKDFTPLAEKLPPATLAPVLGLYFARMAAAIHEEKGTIVQYVGDAIMAMWNAPEPCGRHAERACRAVLACTRAETALYGSEEWKPMPAWVTRFGVHRDTVMVGHFGAPDRLSYTALGDGVNLASRLEGLNKLYGTRVLVSETVYEQASHRFVFRRIDRVAVKGKTRGIEVYELLGTVEEAPAHLDVARVYERALDAYRERRFTEALELLRGQVEKDPPSQVLAARCARMLEAPPPADWDGVFVAMSK